MSRSVHSFGSRIVVFSTRTVHEWGTVESVRLRIWRIGWIRGVEKGYWADRTWTESAKTRILGSASICNIPRVSSWMVWFGWFGLVDPLDIPTSVLKLVHLKQSRRSQKPIRSITLAHVSSPGTTTRAEWAARSIHESTMRWSLFAIHFCQYLVKQINFTRDQQRAITIEPIFRFSIFKHHFEQWVVGKFRLDHEPLSLRAHVHREATLRSDLDMTRLTLREFSRRVRWGFHTTSAPDRRPTLFPCLDKEILLFLLAHRNIHLTH